MSMKIHLLIYYAKAVYSHSLLIDHNFYINPQMLQADSEDAETSQTFQQNWELAQLSNNRR